MGTPIIAALMAVGEEGDVRLDRSEFGKVHAARYGIGDFGLRQFPLHSIHPEAQKAAEASLCADDQGKFWEMHDALFANQSALEVADLKSAAAKLELDTGAFDECLDSGKHAERVNADLQAGVAAGVTGTPAMFINGRFMSGAQSYETIAKVVDDELRRAGG